MPCARYALRLPHHPAPNYDTPMRDEYDSALSLELARARYFAANGFAADGGYGTAWVDAKIGPFPVRIPNTKGRDRAVRIHDLHHVLTGYRTTFRGESEIGAWEVASGCRQHWAAWFLNLAAFGGGLLFAANDVWPAFVRGRSCLNLYDCRLDAALLAKSVGEVRRELHLDEPSTGPANARDAAAFVAWSIVALSSIATLIFISPIAIPAIAIVSRLGRRTAVDSPDAKV